MSLSTFPKATGKSGAKDQKPSAKLDNAYKKLSDYVSDHTGDDLDYLARKIIPTMMTELGKEKTTVVRTFLEGESKDDCKMDDCLRWYLLLRLVNIHSNPTWDLEDRVKLSKIIIKQKPYLPFENPYVGGKDGVHWEQCAGDKMHKPEGKKNFPEGKKNHRSCVETRDTPFRLAAKCGNSAVIAAMVSNGRIFYDQNQQSNDIPYRTEFFDTTERRYLPFFRILQQYEPGQRSGWTALRLATESSGNSIKESSGDSIKTLGELLKVEDIVLVEGKSPDSTFKRAIEGGWSVAVEEFLKWPKLVGAFVTSQNVLLALEKLTDMGKDQLHEQERKRRTQIAKALIAKVKGPDILNRMVVEKIITAGLEDIWNAIDTPKDVLAENLRNSLLHLAVWHQKVEFVKRFLEDKEDEESVTNRHQLDGDTEPRYPLWYNNHPRKTAKGEEPHPKDAKALIRSVIVDKMIHEVAQIETLTDIFYNSDVGDLCFDMSAFNSTSYRVSEFVDSLIWQSRTQTLLSYEKTLRYAEFPSLDMWVEERDVFSESSHLKREHTEVFKILKWLEKKDVTTIIKLKVPDRLINAHDDRKMASFVDYFNVKVLDWKVLDLSISVLGKNTKDLLEELHLYSSGNRAVISHWFSAEGICSLKNETCTADRRKAVVTEIRTKRDECLANKKPHCDRVDCRFLSSKTGTKKLKIGKVESVPWYATPKLPDLRQIAHRLAPRLARWLLELKSKYGAVDRIKVQNPNFRPTRVAILDNGVLSISPVSQNGAEGMAELNGHGDATKKLVGGESSNMAEQSGDSNSLWSRIVDGRSFVDGDSKLSPWLFASNPHGTQMANLICAIDPYCELYVARVAEDAMGITAKRVEQAIRWAIKRNVDVISMSFIIGEFNEFLKKAVDAASEAGIVMTCSAHDEGSRIQKAYPAGHHADGITIARFAACDEYGKIIREDWKGDYDFLIRGHNVAAGVIPFLKSEDTITGSSVSTAIAAGLSSLILTCDRLGAPVRRSPEKQGKARYDLVKDCLDKMAAGHGNFVQLENYGTIRKLLTPD
ncbi:subtilisin-like protein [Lophium mytilinum]|uniref:Subtilisin-like protein n=1 Tax=Lophium mytilinum TaxID=390894 RepID=A0A6A6R2Z5_9PEZI|nr:subtilisin-like protein [Lophium mytilinum]